jgi:hypothetical protein
MTLRAPALVVAAAILSCGYRPVYGNVGGERFHLRLVHAGTPDPLVADDVVAGAREELARSGALASGDGYPRIEIEVLRSDDEGTAIAAAPGGALARASTHAVAARAWVVTAAGGPPGRDTGDLSAREDVALDAPLGSSTDLRATAFHDADALRAAARRLGKKLALRVTGQPAATEDDADRP